MVMPAAGEAALHRLQYLMNQSAFNSGYSRDGCDGTIPHIVIGLYSLHPESAGVRLRLS